MIGRNKILIPLAIIIAGVLISGFLFYLKLSQEKALSPKEAAEKAINYINQNLLQPGMTASLVSTTEENGFYKLRLKIGNDEFDSYVTKDGKFFFPQGYNLEAKTEKVQTQKQEEKFSQAQLKALAKCLNEKGVKFYGTYWCGWCSRQKEIFGEAAQYLPYIECSDPKTKQLTPECQEANITSFPTWLIGGEKKPGFKEPEELAKLSGCSL